MANQRLDGMPPAIPDYEMLRCVGRGAYGEVWLARNVTGSFVAVKVVTRRVFDHDRPFEREFEGIKRFEPISRSDASQVASQARSVGDCAGRRLSRGAGLIGPVPGGFPCFSPCPFGCLPGTFEAAAIPGAASQSSSKKQTGSTPQRNEPWSFRSFRV
jgi:hypothetical protein